MSTQAESNITTINLRRMAGSGGKGAWVRDDTTGEFVKPTRLVHQANSGNETWDWDLPHNGHTYTYQEVWYGKKTRRTITLEAS